MQGIKQQLMTFKVIHHTCTYHMIKQIMITSVMAHITDLLGFISSYKFCEKFNFYRFVQKLHTNFVQNYIMIIAQI